MMPIVESEKQELIQLEYYKDKMRKSDLCMLQVAGYSVCYTGSVLNTNYEDKDLPCAHFTT